MKPFSAIAPLLVFLAVPCSAQRTDGFEFQRYPAGFNATYRAEWIQGERTALQGLLGYNFTDRHDWGRHDDESGGGPGVGVAVQRWLEPSRSGWYYGARMDIWSLSIEWFDQASGDGTMDRSGDTGVIVFQPSARAGYSFGWLGWRLDLGAAFGAEINVASDDEKVGQGAIALVGFGIRF
jgi:hypothetical protein